LPPAPAKSFRILGCRVDRISEKEILDQLSLLLKTSQVHHIVTANALMLLEAKKSPLLKRIIDSADIVAPESAGVSWASKILTGQKVERIPGIDLAFEMFQCLAKNNLPVFLLGSAPGVATMAAEKLLKRIPNFLLGGESHGFFNEGDFAALRKKILKSEAKLVLVGLGMPRQEEWIYNHRKELPPAIYVGVGGSFDVWSGRLKRAPHSFQKFGIEWAYRLLQEPFRLGRIMQLPVFVGNVVFELIFRRESARWN
jgi:N-acetylglucosaminyldiphosphoundecaprenol N-acetyl-beta-D-mannosaminyltransferase